ncbi:MAG TPA: hypothetical protein VF267_05160 [Gammaproteobacteria bacterium]
MRTGIFILAVAALAACESAPKQMPAPRPVENARAAYELAVGAFDAGRYRDAIAGFNGAAQRFQSVDDLHGVATSAISRAETQLLLGENAAAAASLEQARNAIRSSENESLRERTRLLAARLAMPGDAATARRLLDRLSGSASQPVAAQALLLLCELDMRRGETGCASNLAADNEQTAARIAHLQARAAMMRGERETAKTLLEHALAIHRARAFRPGIAAIHETRAELAMLSGDREAAREHLERALYLRLWIRDRVHSAEIATQLAGLSGDETRERYQRWRDTLLNDSSEPEWQEMTETLFNSR